jgi:hypothetical protein
MPHAEKQLFQAQLASSIGTLYTVPEVNTGRAKLTNLVLCNTDSAARDVTLHIVPAGGTASAANRILSAARMPADTSWLLPKRGDIYIEPGGSIQGLCSVAAVVTVTANGEEFG